MRFGASDNILAVMRAMNRGRSFNDDTRNRSHLDKHCHGFRLFQAQKTGVLLLGAKFQVSAHLSSIFRKRGGRNGV